MTSFLGDLDNDTSGFDAPHAGHDMTGQLTTADDAKRFIMAGKATVTLVSKKTNARFTYRVVAARDKDTGELSPDGTLFVGLLRGADNTADYSYVGRISRDVFWPGRKYPKPHDVGPNAPSMLAFKWAWGQLAHGVMPEMLEVWHEGACGRCGRKLTVPSSIASGFGPECIKHVG